MTPRKPKSQKPTAIKAWALISKEKGGFMYYPPHSICIFGIKAAAKDHAHTRCTIRRVTITIEGK